MRYRVYFHTQQPMEFWAYEWEFSKNSTRNIRCWGSENKKIPSVDLMLAETPIRIVDSHDRLVWPTAETVIDKAKRAK